MLRLILPVVAALALSGCEDVAIKTFADATADVNEEFTLGKQLRDRCASTRDVDHCQSWVQYKQAEEAENGLLDYDKALARWERLGPY